MGSGARAISKAKSWTAATLLGVTVLAGGVGLQLSSSRAGTAVASAAATTSQSSTTARSSGFSAVSSVSGGTTPSQSTTSGS